MLVIKNYGVLEKVGNSSTLHCLCLPQYDEALLLTKRKLRASCERAFLVVRSEEFVHVYHEQSLK